MQVGMVVAMVAARRVQVLTAAAMRRQAM